LHIAQRFSYRLAAAAWHYPESSPSWNSGGDTYEPIEYMIFKSPTGRNIPSSIYLPLDRLSAGVENHIIARDFDGSSSNYILPNSSVEYVILIPAQVSYGDVFEEQSDALNDAVTRLEDLFQSYQFTGDIHTDTSSVAGIEYLWGPAEFKMVFWV